VAFSVDLVPESLLKVFINRFAINPAASLDGLDFFHKHCGVANIFVPEYISGAKEVDQIILERCLALLVKDATKETDEKLAFYVEPAVLTSPLHRERWGHLKSAMQRKKLAISLKAVDAALKSKTST
jgi:hypothetical protein